MSEMKNNALLQEKDANNKVYELAYLLVPNKTEEEVPAVYGNLKELVHSFGGDVVSDEMPKMMTLAYPMSKVLANVNNKFNTAHFGWVKFIMEPEKVLEIKERLKLDVNIIRFLILKTVKENTIATKRFVRGETYRRPLIKKTSNEAVVPINKEEVDKEIDALIAAYISYKSKVYKVIK